MRNTKKNISKKMTGSIMLAVILSICLCMTTFALVYATVSVDNNLFNTGKVEINLNDGNPVISEHEFLFEPGMTVKKDFFIENNSSWSVYYKLYFDHVSGGLADVLEIAVKDDENTLYEGTASTLNRVDVQAVEEMLPIGEKKTLSVYFHFPENKGNDTQNSILTFDICADAVQAKNNPKRVFD